MQKSRDAHLKVCVVGPFSFFEAILQTYAAVEDQASGALSLLSRQK